MDPKASIMYPDATQTKTWYTKELVNAGKNPVWRESVSVDVKKINGFLEISVFDVDVFSNEIVGKTNVQLRDLCKAQPVDLRYKIYYKNKVAGTVRITAQWRPNTPPKRKPTPPRPTPTPRPKPIPNKKRVLPKITPDMKLADFKRACFYYFNLFDKDPNDGQLNLREFRNTYLKVLPKTMMRKATKWSQIQQVLDGYDTDNSSSVSWEEFWNITRFKEQWNSKAFKDFNQKQNKKN